MKIKEISLENFKRFTHLTLKNINPEAKLVVLIGPNGCGKSSVFDAFETIGGKKKERVQEDAVYLKKFSDRDFKISIESNNGSYNSNTPPPPKSFYIRSAYRVDSDFQTNQIGKKDSMLLDKNRPKKLIDLDKRVQDNYERLVGTTIQRLYSGNKDDLSVLALREELIGRVRDSMGQVFDDLLLEGIGDPFTDGQFFFTKGSSKNFPYKNLSAGEKGAFDVILDLIIKVQEFDDTVFVIDEPELHMHSRLQQKLLVELFRLIPEKCQLWIATHSIGFIKGAVELRNKNQDEVVLFDFDEKDFDQQQTLEPMIPTSDKIRKIFAVAIDDLANMVTPSEIVFCEGSRQLATNQNRQEFDSKVYNIIFANLDVLFIAADNKVMAQRAGTCLLKILTDSGAVRIIKSLVDKDDLTDQQVLEYKTQDSTQKFLSRKTIENFLFDSEIIDKYCKANNIDTTSVTSRLSHPITDDAKQVQSSIMQQCSWRGNDVNAFKIALARLITNETKVYLELKKDLELDNLPL